MRENCQSSYTFLLLFNLVFFLLHTLLIWG